MSRDAGAPDSGGLRGPLLVAFALHAAGFGALIARAPAPVRELRSLGVIEVVPVSARGVPGAPASDEARPLSATTTAVPPPAHDIAPAATATGEAGPPPPALLHELRERLAAAIPESGAPRDGVLRLTLDPGGRVVELTWTRGSGDPAWDEGLARAIRAWTPLSARPERPLALAIPVRWQPRPADR